MAGPRTALGDSHNFGRRVANHGGRVRKPRALLWERLVLSGESPLRRVLVDASERDGMGKDTFGFLPDLAFFSSSTPEELGGEVERVSLEPLGTLSSAERDLLALIVGRSLALWSWLGVSDLHWENLVLGRGEGGHIVFAPLDVEMILADLSLPTETKLLPDADPEYADVCRHACGVRRVLPYLGKPVDAAYVVAMAGAYLEALALLDRHARAIADVFAGLPELGHTPIRVCLRGTDEYVRAEEASLWPPLLDEEKEQLERGDIPYFFRLYGRPGIHYYGDVSLREVKTLPLHGDVPQLDPMLDVMRGLRAPSRKKLREEGLFTLLGAFDHAGLKGRVASGDLAITFAAKSLVVRRLGLGGRGRRADAELSVRRDLRAFVSSVYQPCHCGEVLTVFVPPVTKCDSTAKASF